MLCVEDCGEHLPSVCPFIIMLFPYCPRVEIQLNWALVKSLLNKLAIISKLWVVTNLLKIKNLWKSAGYKNILNQFEDTKIHSSASEMSKLKDSIILSRAWSQGDPKHFYVRALLRHIVLHKLLLYLFMWHRLFLQGWVFGNSVGFTLGNAIASHKLF